MTPVPDSRALYGRLLTYVKPYWRMFALSLVALILTAATEPMLPALFKPLLDQGFVAKDQAFIRWVPLLLLALFMVRGLTEKLFRRAGQPYIRGHYHVRGNQLYVNRGLGFGRGGSLVRVRSEPEVTLATLRRDDERRSG